MIGPNIMNNVLHELSNYNGHILHTYGNHDLYNMTREIIASKLNIPFVKEKCYLERDASEQEVEELVGYYSYTHPSCPSIIFIMLDSYDICIEGRCSIYSKKYKEAENILLLNNPNFPREKSSIQGLDGIDRRFVSLGGAIGSCQKQWLEKTLGQARNDGQKAIILSHQPISPASCNPICLMWNFEDIMDIFTEYKDVVAVSFSGHWHLGGYHHDLNSNIHYRVFEAMLESKPPIKTYAICDIYEDRFVIRGQGDCQSDVYYVDRLAF